MSDIPKNVLEHFTKVREESGVSISAQMKMHEKGYRIVKVINDD